MAQSREQTTQGSCEIERLPEEILVAVITLTSPHDACRAAAVSRTFRPAADSDAVWSRFLPRDLPQLADGELPATPLSKKALFLRLSNKPVLLPCKLVSMQLDNSTGAKCYTLSARALHIAWGNTPQYWEWIDLTPWYRKWINLGADEVNRFSEAAKLRGVWWLEVRGKINRMMLSQNSTYAAYMVFKLAANGFDLLRFPFQDALVSVAGNDSTQQVCLQSYMEVGDDGVPQKHVLTSHIPADRRPEVPLTDDIILPRKRTDGWMEVELGNFFNEEGCDDEVSVSLMETKTWKYGLIVWGIEIRVKK